MYNALNKELRGIYNLSQPLLRQNTILVKVSFFLFLLIIRNEGGANNCEGIVHYLIKISGYYKAFENNRHHGKDIAQSVLEERRKEKNKKISK